MQQPLVSVVMPLYNGKPYVVAAIDSVVRQTFADWELLVIDDGSTDGGLELVKSTYADVRIRPLANAVNRGVAYTRGVGIAEARGEYLAWLDCDDIIMPERLEMQLDFLRRHPEIGLCGTWIERFGGDDHSVSRPPTNPELLRCMLLFTPIVPNATVVLRLALVRQYGISYDHELPIAEDYDFVLQCSQHFSVGMVDQVLYRYRVTENSLMERYDAAEDKAFAAVKVVHARALAAFGLQAMDRELRMHRALNSALIFDNYSDYTATFRWLLGLLDRNDRTGYYDREALRKAATDRFYFISKKATRFGIRTLVFYVRNAMVHQLLYLSPVPLLKLTVRCIIRYAKF